MWVSLFRMEDTPPGSFSPSALTHRLTCRALPSCRVNASCALSSCGCPWTLGFPVLSSHTHTHITAAGSLSVSQAVSSRCTSGLCLTSLCAGSLHAGPGAPGCCKHVRSRSGWSQALNQSWIPPRGRRRAKPEHRRQMFLGDCGFREFDTETSGKSWEEPESWTVVYLFLFAFNSFPKAFLLLLF